MVGAALRMAGAELSDLDELALSVPSTEGLVLLPFLDGERTPALPDATGLLHGLTRANMTPAHLVRASVEGMLCGLSDAVEALDGAGVDPRRIVLIGGAARSGAVQEIAAGLFGLPIALPEPAEYVALGAARQAAWTLSGDAEPPTWSRDVSVVQPTGDDADYYRSVRSRYTEVLAGAQPLLEGLSRTGSSSLGGGRAAGPGVRPGARPRRRPRPPPAGRPWPGPGPPG